MATRKSSCATTKNEYSQYAPRRHLEVVSPIEFSVQFLRWKVNDRRRRPRIHEWVSMIGLKSLDRQGDHDTLLGYGMARTLLEPTHARRIVFSTSTTSMNTACHVAPWRNLLNLQPKAHGRSPSYLDLTDA